MQKEKLEISAKSLQEGQVAVKIDATKVGTLNTFANDRENLGFQDGDKITLPALSQFHNAIRHNSNGDITYPAVNVSVARGNKTLTVEMSVQQILTGRVYPVENTDTIERDGKVLVRLSSGVRRFKGFAGLQIVDDAESNIQHLSNEKPITLTLKGVKCHATRFGTYDEAYRTIEVFGTNTMACDL